MSHDREADIRLFKRMTEVDDEHFMYSCKTKTDRNKDRKKCKFCHLRFKCYTLK